jgi:hypothetical protein
MSDGAPTGPPSYPYPGYENETRGPLFVGLTTALTVLATLFVAGRIYSRLISVGKVFVDDWIMILSIVRAVPRSEPEQSLTRVPPEQTSD